MNEKVNAETQPNLVELKAKYDELKERATKVALTIQSAIPVNQLTLEAQQAFLLTLSDLQLFDSLAQRCENTFNAIAFEKASPEEIEQAGGLAGTLVALAVQLVDGLMEQFGVAEEAILPAVSADLVRQMDLIETIVARAESSVSKLKQ